MGAGYGNWSTLWPYAVLLSASGVWAVYHFLAPSTWRNWAGAGLVQAFIIALYAEMYGFPLILPLEIPLFHASGHLWATLLGYGRLGAAVEMILGSIFVVTGLLLIIKGWVKVYFSGEKLVTDGVYGLVRHPQYVGIFLIVFGQLVHWPTIPTLALTPVIVRLARREETALVRRFGDHYLRYREQAPMFVPIWQRLRRAWT